MKTKSRKSERQIRLEKHHSTRRRKKLEKMIAVGGSMLILAIPVYFIYFT